MRLSVSSGWRLSSLDGFVDVQDELAEVRSQLEARRSDAEVTDSNLQQKKQELRGEHVSA